MGLVLVKHTPMKSGKASGVYKDDRPVSFMSQRFIPSEGYKWQVQNMYKVSAVWCARFDGSTIEGFLEHLFRDRTKRAKPGLCHHYLCQWKWTCGSVVELDTTP